MGSFGFGFSIDVEKHCDRQLIINLNFLKFTVMIKLLCTLVSVFIIFRKRKFRESILKTERGTRIVS